VRTVEDFERFLAALERIRAARGGRIVTFAGLPQRRVIANKGHQFAHVKGKRSASLKARANRRKVAR